MLEETGVNSAYTYLQPDTVNFRRAESVSEVCIRAEFISGQGASPVDNLILISKVSYFLALSPQDFARKSTKRLVA